MKNCKFYWLFLFILLLTSCSKRETEILSQLNIATEDMNSELIIDVPPNLNTYELGDSIWLSFVNISDTPIVLGGDYGVYLYQKTDGGWSNVDNKVTYFTNDKWAVAWDDRKRLPQEQWFAVDPDIISNQLTEIRVVMIGNFVKANGRLGKEVGGYVDVTLYP